MSVVLNVRRRAAEAVQPAGRSPLEVKRLSDLDNDVNHRLLVSVILLFKKQGQDDKDPVEKVKKALGEALVYYYPWAGRLKEGADGKLVVECTAEGVVFVEAEAQLSLGQLGEDPNFSCVEEEVLYPMSPTLGAPLFTMQLTRFLCGGFVLGFTYHHSISDGLGVAQFLSAVFELAEGAETPSVLPVWDGREALNGRSGPPHGPSYATLLDTLCGDHIPPPEPPQGGAASYRSFFFGPKELAAIRTRVPPPLRSSCTSFELILAFVLHCRVTSFQHAHLREQMRVLFMVNCRDKFADLPIPAAYCGNAVLPAILVCPVEDLYHLGSAVERVKKAKEAFTLDHVHSILDILVTRSQSTSLNFSPPTCFFSDLSRVGFSTLHFGSWGKPKYVYRPPLLCNRHFSTYMLPFTNSKGEEGRLLDLYLPKDAMDKFTNTLRTLLASS